MTCRPCGTSSPWPRTEWPRTQFETNLFGALALTPAMRAAGTGWIARMSPLVGVVPGPGGAAYVGSKTALDAMSESLAGEMAPFGIRVLIVEPGGHAEARGFGSGTAFA
ncbi:SDR family NAD(P)-dependent oxidoreductase [Dactylosporangium sp. CA-233914]|uniref:SDR family NAD(P)-dependent oxidoreductase n=1 Tax=Dactylosporangium sp. CA-233914 TaxID=3239934 RepID=UPI003D8BC76F